MFSMKNRERLIADAVRESLHVCMAALPQNLGYALVLIQKTVSMTMICAHVLNKGAKGEKSG